MNKNIIHQNNKKINTDTSETTVADRLQQEMGAAKFAEWKHWVVDVLAEYESADEIMSDKLWTIWDGNCDCTNKAQSCHVCRNLGREMKTGYYGFTNPLTEWFGELPF